MSAVERYCSSHTAIQMVLGLSEKGDMDIFGSGFEQKHGVLDSRILVARPEP
jgi:hypothetical protein